MSMRSWFKAHRKQVITHTLIVSAFVLFLLFLSEPLFDRLEEIMGEAKLQQNQPAPNVPPNVKRHLPKF